MAWLSEPHIGRFLPWPFLEVNSVPGCGLRTTLEPPELLAKYRAAVFPKSSE